MAQEERTVTNEPPTTTTDPESRVEVTDGVRASRTDSADDTDNSTEHTEDPKLPVVTVHDTSWCRHRTEDLGKAINCHIHQHEWSMKLPETGAIMKAG